MSAVVASRVAPHPPADDVRELLTQLGELHGRLQELLHIATDKLGALRRADAGALTQCAAREEALLRETLGCEQQHKALLARLAQGLRLGGDRPPTLTQLAGRLPAAESAILRAKSEVLRRTAAELQQKNRLAAEVARRLQMHVRGVFADLAGATETPAVYGPRGRPEAGRPRQWLNALG